MQSAIGNRKSAIAALLLALLLAVVPALAQNANTTTNAGLDGWLNHLSEGQPGASSFAPTSDPGSPNFTTPTRPTYTAGTAATIGKEPE